MGDAKRVDEMMRDAANDLAMPQPGPEALAYAQQMLRIGAASIEAARAAPPPSPASDRSRFADAVAALPGARMALSTLILDRVERARAAGPSRAARLVAYRCAVMAATTGPRPSFTEIERDAHAMLAAEREAT